MNKKIYISFWFVGAYVFLYSCTFSPTPINNISATNTSYNYLVDSTPTHPALTRMPFATPTSLPSISRNTAREILTKFMQTNGGCALPCLAGLTPGISKTNEMNSFQTYFNKAKSQLDIPDKIVGISPSTRDNQGGVRLQFWNNDVSNEVSIDYYFEQNQVYQIALSSWSSEYLSSGAKTLYADPEYKNILNYFSISNILNTYGTPSEVLIAPFLDDPGHPSPPAQYSFSTVLIYPKQGFLVQYVTVREQTDKYFVSCLANSHIDVSVWIPTKNLDLKNAVMHFSGVDSINSANFSYFQKIGNAAQFDIGTFYNTYKFSDSQDCIRTIKSLWHTP